jgi:steroid delta-isomerase
MFFVLALVFSALFGFRDARAEGAEEEIEAALIKWKDNFNSGNADRICDLFAPDLIANYGDFPQISYGSVCKQLKSSLANPDLDFHYELGITEIIVSGDVGIVRLIWDLTVTDLNGKVVERTKDRGMDIFRRQTDGSWKISRYLAYPTGG